MCKLLELATRHGFDEHFAHDELLFDATIKGPAPPRDRAGLPVVFLNPVGASLS